MAARSVPVRARPQHVRGRWATGAQRYFFSGAAVTVNLSTGAGSGGDAQGNLVSNIEILQGSNFSDLLTGDGNANVLVGGAGADTLD